MKLGLLFFLALIGLGCAAKQSYLLTVANQTSMPLTLGVIKDGPPYERELGTIDQWAIESPLDTLPPWGFVVPPGKTADTGPITGHFDKGVSAYLRIYRGQHANAGLIATSSASPDRLDVFLFPGKNEITIQDKPGGALAYQRIKPIPR